MKYNLDDTIVGVATGVSNSGVSIIRLSGNDSLNILNKIFKSKEPVSTFKSHTIHYGFVYDDTVKIDEVLVSIMLSPRSYTTEDVVEINCHGGIVTTTKVLDTVIKYGARLASPGEFTKRAFLNGRIDLVKAEAISSMISAKTEREQEIGLNQLSGSLSKEISDYRDKILTLIATSEASIDYPEHDMDHDNVNNISDIVSQLINSMKALSATSNKGKIIRDGIETVILGKPNVGKSSLLNKLVGEDIAIVTPTAGTTRDTITEFINFNGIILKLVDTAGIRNTVDEVEKIGVEKSKKKALKGELILFLVDGSKEIDDEDIELLKFVSNKNVIVLINKSDLVQKVDLNLLKKIVGVENICSISVLSNDIQSLYDRIEEIFLSGIIDNESDNLIINSRHESLLNQALKSLTQVLEGINLGMSEDLLVIDLQDAYMYLGEIIGESLDDDIIDKIFSQFCLGK